MFNIFGLIDVYSCLLLSIVNAPLKNENEFKKLGNKKDFEQYWMMIDEGMILYALILTHSRAQRMHSHDWIISKKSGAFSAKYLSKWFYYDVVYIRESILHIKQQERSKVERKSVVWCICELK